MRSGVYIVVADEFRRFKLGYSSDVDRRLDQIQTCCPTRCRIADVLVDADFETEAAIHGLLFDQHVIGEWFDISGLPIAQRQFEIVRAAQSSVAEIIAEHVPADLWDGVKANLYAAGANSVAHALTNITGQSLMDKGGWG